MLDLSYAWVCVLKKFKTKKKDQQTYFGGSKNLKNLSPIKRKKQELQKPVMTHE